MTARQISWAMAGLLILILGFGDAAPAARKIAGSARRRAPDTKKRLAGARERIPSPPLQEWLTLPQGGRRPAVGGQVSVRIKALAAILVDAEAGTVLFERSPDARLPPASVTKILTALIVLEQGRLDDTVVVSRGAARTGGHRLGLRAGQRISLKDLVAAILIRSANDAAVAAAEHVAGGLRRFMALMNARAKDLGMTNSHFANPHGLHRPSHYSTARDIATLTQAALANPTFAGLVRTPQARVTIWSPGRRALVPQARIVRTHNRLLGQMNGVDGVKTGYTKSAGRCLVASATRRGRRLIAVLLNDPQRWADAAALMEYGFDAIRDSTPGPAGMTEAN